MGAPSTLKLPLWDKASAEFCFAKSRELLTKPTAWTSYCDVEYDTHLLDSAALKQNLVKSTEFLENGHSNRKSVASCLEFEANHHHLQNGKNPFDFSNESKRISASFVDRYFDHPPYADEEASNGFSQDELSYEDEQKILQLEKECRNAFLANFPEFGKMLNEKNKAATQTNKLNESPSRMITNTYELQHEKLANLELGTRPKATNGDNSRMADLSKKLEMQKQQQSRSYVGSPRRMNHELNKYSDSSDSMKTISDSPRANLEAARATIQNYRMQKYNDQNGQSQSNGHDTNGYPYAISNNPLFMEKRDSPLYSSSESLKAGLQLHMRRNSDAEVNHNQQQYLNSKYQREVSGLESVKNYLESKKGQSGMNLGFSKLTQNMIQLGKNIAQNTRNLGGLDMNSSNNSSNSPLKKPKHLDLNLPLQNSNHKSSNSPTMHQRILEPPTLYQNDKKMSKADILVERLQTSNFRLRASSLSDNRRPHVKNFRRSFHQGTNDSSEDSDSISHSETDIRGRLRLKRRHKRMSHNVRLNFKNQKAAAAAAYQNLLHPNSVRGLSNQELEKSPPPSTSFLNSLSPPFNNSINNVISWPESAPSSSITFTSNSDLDSDTSSEYPEFNNDILTFPPSPAP